MTRACLSPVRAAVGDAFSDAEIDDILQRLERRYRQKRAKAPTGDDRAAWGEAAAELTREQVEGALQLRRLEAASKRAKGLREERLSAMLKGGMDEAEALRAFNVGSERQVAFSAASVDAEARGRATGLWADVERGLGAHEGLMEKVNGRFFGASSDEFERKVAREMARLNGADIESTGDDDARKAAEVFTAALEKNRLAQNAQGAFIARLEGRVAMQAHDRLKVAGGFWREFRAGGILAPAKWKEARMAAARRAFRAWREFIEPKLDGRTFEGIDPEDLGDAEEAAQLHAQGLIDGPDDLKGRFLYRAWWNIVTGGLELSRGAGDVGEFTPPASKARSVSKSRVLHFTSPDEWMDYHARFGRGSLYGVVMNELDRGGRNAALMARWGPSPDKAFEDAVAGLSERARERGDSGAAVKLQSRMRRAEFDEVTGEGNRPDNLRLAIVGRTIRTSQTLGKLGGMVLSATSDLSLASHTFARDGGSFLAGYEGALKGLSRLHSDEQKLAAEMLDVGGRQAASHLTTRFMASDGPLGWMAWAQRVFYKVNGFEAWLEGLRQGYASMLSHLWGSQADRGFAELEAGTRETFERYGITPGVWDAVRQHVPTLGDGRRYFGLDALDAIEHDDLHSLAGISDPKQRTKAAAEAMREELRTRFQAMVSERLDDATTEARARERVGLHRGLKPGTIWGEAVRAFTQFWSFTSAIMGRHLAPSLSGFGGRAPAAILAHLIVGTTLMGYLGMQAKQLAKGRTPRPLVDPQGNPASVWIAAMLQGGGLGLYGDFLFGEYARNGMPATISSFAGPSVSELERLRLVVGAAVGAINPMTSAANRAQSGHVFEQQGFNFARDNMPFLNVWYTRLALDYLVLWRLQEAISPGYLQRYEHNVKTQQGTDFLVHPTSALS